MPINTQNMLRNIVEKAAIGTAGASAIAYVGLTSPYVAYVTFNFTENKVGFLMCTREHMDGMYELETFELVSGCLQSKFIQQSWLPFSLVCKGPYQSVGRKKYVFLPFSPQKLQHYIDKMPLNTFGSTLDAANNTLKGKNRNPFRCLTLSKLE